MGSKFLLRNFIDAMPGGEEKNRKAPPCIQDIKKTAKESVQESMLESVDETAMGGWIPMPFLHDLKADIKAKWDLNDFDPGAPNDVPNMNLAVMGLILATNCESTVGRYAFSLVEYSLKRLGFTNIVHHHFEIAEQVNYPAMAFGRSKETVNGKYVVAAVYRGSSSVVDFVSDVKAEPGGFHKAGVHATDRLRAYCKAQKLTKENTILFITGHSYGAACASLVGISSTDLAERDSIFCYPFATPNYIRHGLTGDGMKMFSFDSNEDIVPQVPVGPNLDKTGVDIKFDRLDLELNHPEQYARFAKLYKHFRDAEFDSDTDFLPDAYTFKPYVSRPVDNKIIRNHMPYTYMPLLLSGLPDEEAYSYIIEVPENEDKEPEWVMYIGEVYKLPFSQKGQFTWESSDEEIAPIDENGRISGKAPGVIRLKITDIDGRKAVFKVRVSEV